MTDADIQRFFGSEGLWQNPSKTTEDTSTVGSFHIYHEELVGEVVGEFSTYQVVILHVRLFPRGKGFSFSIRAGYDLIGTGSFVEGTSQEVYDDAKAKAFDRAIAMMSRFDREMNEILARSRNPGSG